MVTGPITANMSRALQICYDAVPAPKLVVLCGTDAISGGIFNPEVSGLDGSNACLDRSFLDTHKVDLYIPGNPAHPLAIVNGLLKLTER